MAAGIKRLPDSEFKIMKCVWRLSEDVTSLSIMEMLGDDADWKPQTVLTLLKRLCDKGFLSSIKRGRERLYTPIISEEDYLAIETGDFVDRYSGLPLQGLVKTLFKSTDLSTEDIDELKALLQSQEEKLK